MIFHRSTRIAAFSLLFWVGFTTTTTTIAFHVPSSLPRKSIKTTTSGSISHLWAKKNENHDDMITYTKNATDDDTIPKDPPITEKGLFDSYQEFQDFLKETSSSTGTILPTTTTSTEVDLAVDSAAKEDEETPMMVPNTMNQGIFTFNKVMIDTIYELICFLYPVNGSKRDYARFYVLETVARIPYFAYLTVLHFKETFGQRGETEKMRTHYAEADNELHHLLIMESLGGNELLLDRVFAQTVSFFYFWYVILVYSWNQSAAYHLSELIEAHAYRTYDGFTKNYKGILQGQPVPDIAEKYYERDDPYLFDLVCRVKDSSSSLGGGEIAGRPKMKSLYDVFLNIRDDENEHWKCLCNLVQYDDMNAVNAGQVKATEPEPSK